MTRFPVLGEVTPETWLVLRMLLVTSDSAEEGWFTAAEVVLPLNQTAITEASVVRTLFANLIQHGWMEGPREATVASQTIRQYRLTGLGIERIQDKLK